VVDDPQPPSLAQLYRDFGDRWEIEQIPRGTQWIAVLRDSGGDYVVMVAAHDVNALRFRMDHAEQDEPKERENASAAGKSC
jgi:hypothetical protein